MSRVGPRGLLAAFLLIVTGLRLAYVAAGPLDLAPDEAHYWEWSRRLDLSYYSKGPMVAYLIHLLTWAFGTSELSIRLGAILIGLAGALCLYAFARECLGDERAALAAVVALHLTPLFAAGGILMTIDPPFFLFWLLAMILLARALRGAAWAWPLAGIAFGLGLLAKYTMLFLLPSLALYWLLAPEHRPWLRRPGPYVALGIGLGLFAQVLVWNARYGWVSARHVAGQGEGSGLTLVYLGEFVGGQLGVLSPLIGLALAWGVFFGWREGLLRRREPYRFLMAFALPLLGFYLLLALRTKVQANWPAAAYLPLALITAGGIREVLPRLGAGRRRGLVAYLVVAAAVALALTGIAHQTEALAVLGLALPPDLDPTARLKGWEELGRAVTGLRGAMPAPERVFLFSNRYQIASELAFYVAGRPATYNVNLGRRLNQYDLWGGWDRLVGWDAIYVREGVREVDPEIARAFERVDPPVLLEIRRGERVVRTFSIFRCFGFLGMEPPKTGLSY